jgi:hypothetical protein
MTSTFLWLYTWFLAFFRLDLSAVCVMAAKGYDYHDYPDTDHGEPWHMIEETCVRCGRKFYV